MSCGFAKEFTQQRQRTTKLNYSFSILAIKAVYKHVYIRWQKHVLSYVPIRKVMESFKHFISPVLGCLPLILLVHAQNQSGNDNLGVCLVGVKTGRMKNRERKIG